MKISQYLKNILTKTLIILDLIVNYIVYVPKFWCRIQYFGCSFFIRDNLKSIQPLDRRNTHTFVFEVLMCIAFLFF